MTAAKAPRTKKLTGKCVRTRNAEIIQGELNAILKRAHAAGVQVELHRVRKNTTEDCTELESVEDNPETNGDFLVASADWDREVAADI